MLHKKLPRLNLFASLTRPFRSLKLRIEEWVRREIVDDDPWDDDSWEDEMRLSKPNQPDGSEVNQAAVPETYLVPENCLPETQLPEN